MPDYEIRPAREAEAAQIKDLIHMVGINPTGLDWKRFLVAVYGPGEVIGCGQVKPHGEDILEMASIAVHPDHRGKGIARAIIERREKGKFKSLDELQSVSGILLKNYLKMRPFLTL